MSQIKKSIKKTKNFFVPLKKLNVAGNWIFIGYESKKTSYAIIKKEQNDVQVGNLYGRCN